MLGGVLYAWPHLQLREAGKEAQELSREKERLLEENRKLRLEKAALENLRRVETIATRDLGLVAPAPEDTIVVEMPPAAAPPPRGWPRGPSEPARPQGNGTREGTNHAHEPHAARADGDGARPSPRDRMVRLRIMLLALGASLWALVIVVRLVPPAGAGAAVLPEARARARASARSPSKRGAGPSSTARGRPLAVSVDAESIYAVPQDVTDPARTATALARALGLDAAGRKELLVQLQKNRAFVWIKRKLSPGAARAVRDLQLDGIGFLSESRRYYPKRELASQVLGYVGLDNQGMSGVEYAFEEALKGRKETVVVTTDARRRPVGHTEKPSTEGLSVVLALDESIQHVAERELDRAMAETQSVGGDRGGGRALHGRGAGHGQPADLQPQPLPELPARALEEPRGDRRLRAGLHLQDRHRRRGAAGAGGRAATRSSTAATGRSRSRGSRINDHAVFDKLTFAQAVAKSSDIGMIRVAQRLGREQFARYMRDFGFGAPTGVELPGESAGPAAPHLASGARSPSPRSPSARRWGSPRCRWPWPPPRWPTAATS